MPTIHADGCPIHVEVEGPENAPVLMLSNSLGATLHMWDPRCRAFTEHFRLVRYDRRGHGKSGAPAGPYTMEMLGRDVLAILDALKIKKMNWCGLSMGGMVGMWLGANAPERIDRLVLSNTVVLLRRQDVWNDRIKRAREGAWRRSSAAPWSAGSPKISASVSPTKIAVGQRDAPFDHAGGLHRLLRGGPRHGPRRDHSVDHGADPDHRRHGTTRPPRWRPANLSAAASRAPA